MRVSFTSRKTTFCCIFPPIGLTKTIAIPLFFRTDVGNLLWNIKLRILDVDVVSVDLNKTILKFDDF